MNEVENKEGLFSQIFITRTHGFIDISKKQSFWQELANEYCGTLTVKQAISKDLECLSMQIPYRQYFVEFTESDTHPLKISCKLEPLQPFEFAISYEDTLEKLLKLFGQQDIQVGDEEFDRRYLVQGKDAGVVAELLSSSRMKTILLSNNVFSYSCTYDKKENMLYLKSLVSRTVNSKAELAELFNLFCMTINKMEVLSLVK